MASTLTEAGIFCAAAIGAGLLWNWLSPDGIRLTESYSIARSREPRAEDSSTGERSTLDLARELGLQTVSFADFQTYADEAKLPGHGVVLLDARKEESFQQGHIEGAILMDPYHLDQHLDEDQIALLRETPYVVIYCTGGDCEDSILLAQDLVYGPAQIPIESVFISEGGINEWRAKGLPLVK